jgi:uncharacterized protein (TIGR00290 family)
MSIPVVASWSGGKDSCLACYRAIQEGLHVKYLLNFISKKYRRSCFHGLEAKLLDLQAELLGIPLVQRAAAFGMDEYEKTFKQAVRGLKKRGITAMVFGDVYVQGHKSWVERVTKELQVRAFEPLWGEDPEKIVREFIKSGFKAIVVSAQAKKLGKGFVGRWLDKGLLKDLKARGICPCGEGGEFHTFVTDGPIFKKRIEITQSRPVFKQGFWKYWFLDIQKYKVVEKGKR